MSKFKINKELEYAFLSRSESALVAAKLIMLVNKKGRFCSDSQRTVSFRNSIVRWSGESKTVCIIDTRGAGYLRPEHRAMILDHIVTTTESYYRAMFARRTSKTIGEIS